MDSPTTRDSNFLSASYGYETNYQQEQRKEGLTAKLRQTINAAGKRVQGTTRPRKSSAPDLTNLTAQSQVKYQKRKNYFIENLIF
jgi:hypothetical protein